ncbi:MAG: Na+/H+ antiporter subunit E [Dethiobacter sp.]|nr:Na+/H+ antiporter subunit E [Dethiobacter sp.]MBS3982263.1 Na+/H+ antiporter subunit E [Dethiobacter sp.]
MYFQKRIDDPKGFMLFTIILLIFWFLMSPSLSLRNIAVGLVCCLAVTYFWSPDLFKPGQPFRIAPRQVAQLAVYLLLLAYNVVVANVHVALIVLSPKLPISPGFILVKTKLQNELTRTLYANSITLTPGTITINLNSDRLLVHALTKGTAQGVCDWHLENRLREMEVSKGD